MQTTSLFSKRSLFQAPARGRRFRPSRVFAAGACALCGAGFLGLGAASAQAGAIAPGDLMVFQAGNSTTPATAGSTPLLIDEINPLLTNQTTAVQSFNVSTTSTSLYTDSSASDGDLTLSANGTLLTFSGWVGQNANEASGNGSRGAGVLDSFGNFTQPAGATYTASTSGGTQPRSSYTADGTSFLLGDNTGLFANGGTSPLTGSVNTRALKDFGGTLYAIDQKSTPFLAAVTVSGSTVSYAALPGLNIKDANSNDFVMLSTGAAGAGVMNLLYVADSGGSGQIDKFALIGGSWTAEGTASVANLSGITAENDPVSGADLFVTVDTSTVGSLEEIADTSAATSSIALGSATTLYTAPTGDFLRGVSFAPVPEPASWPVLAAGLALFLGARAFRARRESLSHTK